MGVKRNIKTGDVWKCGRCGKVSGPCPRGGCEAEIVGRRIITTITEYRDLTVEEKNDINMERGSIYFNPKQV